MTAIVIPFRAPVANDNRTDPTPPPTGTGVVIRLPVSNETPDMRFQRAYHAASVARAEQELHHARYLAWLALEKTAEQDWRQSPYAGDQKLEDMRALMFKLAVTPATTRGQAASKKAMIGKVWLKAEGEIYDAMRAGVEIDDLRFGRSAA